MVTLNDKYHLSKNYADLGDYINLSIALNSILIILYVFSEIRANYIFNKAEKNRRLQYLDNSFGTNFAGVTLSNYFSQDRLNSGFHKLAVNCFENTFHTFNIVQLMQPKLYLKAGAVMIIFLFSATVGDKGIVRALIEAILPLALLQDAIKTSLFVNKLENLLESFKTFFSNLRGNSFVDKEPEVMKLVIDYETSLAWASLPLDSKLFFKEQTRLASEWNILKQSYQIQ